MTFTFQGHKVILKPLSPKEVHEDQLKMKTKGENEKEKERKDKLNHNISSSTTKSNIFDSSHATNCTSKVSFFLIFFITKGFYLPTIFVKDC